MLNMQIYTLNKRESILLYSGIAIAALLLSILFYRNIFFAAVIIPFIPRIRSLTTDKLREKRIRAYQVQFKDFLFMLSTSIAAGRSMKDSIGEAIPALKEIYGEAAVLPTELGKAYERIAVGGENDIAVLTDLACASGLEDVSDFVSIYSICKTTGANMILALNKAASVIIDKMTIEKEIDELVRRKESEGLIIFVMPVLVILFLNLFAPDYISIMYESFAGRIIMTVAIASELAVYELIQKIVDVEI